MREDTSYTIRILRGDFTTGSKAIRTVIKEDHEPIFTNKFDILVEMDQFLERHKIIHEETNHLSSIISIREIEFVVKNFPTRSCSPKWLRW